ncbi:DUF2780 domain-containing protein [Gilvimarinus sp. SDUM040013]|uniref:DUF2780 domain-containing protein n=1 Tax=Gilvimarinus gilvus TaxID=3058038 RepID=A0ABU4S132_9GAMM|nr:DUF2780 domain-containing protein [Gilvimarinus sp. SDUM040013]MDO3384807.1 DUF2780 domain-containing protein [Gilvimarinus sp. SDUM040013]MDX6850860.1 DUF2780 domain-containing protein [Gilvimarinus sp. SDUM040013]
MKRLLLVCVCLFVGVNASALDLQDVGNQLSGSETSAPESLISSLTEQFGITSDQAIGGTSALVAMAANNLSDDSASQLTDIIPTSGGGLTDTLIKQVTSMESVRSAFDTLGMDPALVEQFTPVVLDYVSSNGGKELLGQLTSLWGG